MRGCWTKFVYVGGPLRSLVGWPAWQRWLVRILSANNVAGGAITQLSLTPSTMTSGDTTGTSEMRTLAINNNEDKFALLGNNVSLC